MALLLVLQIASAAVEAVSLGAVIPFLAALANAPRLLIDPRIKTLVDVFSISTHNQLIIWMAALFASAVLLSGIVRIITLRAQTSLAAEIGSDLSIEVFRRTMYQSYRFHTQHNSSELISGITQDVAGIAGGFLLAAFALITNTLIAIGIVASLLWFDAAVTIVAGCVIGSIYFFIMNRSQRLIFSNGEKTSKQNELLVRTLQEGLGGIRDVLVDSTQPVFVKAYSEADREYRKAIAENAFVAAAPRYIVEPLATAAIAALAVGLAWENSELDRILPLLGLLALGANRLLPAIQQCFGSIVAIRGYQASLRKVLIALQRPVDEVQLAPAPHPMPLLQGLQLEDIWFRYSDTEWTLKGINLKVLTNTTVALMGASGSGKSTVADIVLGLLAPQKGQLSVDGIPLRGKQLRAWQAAIAHVPQSIYLSDASIAENIAFGVPFEEIDHDRIREAAQLAHIADFVESRPNGYSELVGERGIRLSGGQRQRIGIARALYKRAAVIIFDEATSALDTVTEHEVMEAINGLSHKVTIILISHRIGTVRQADVIYEFAQGRITASGRYEQLLESSETFRTMASAGR